MRDWKTASIPVYWMYRCGTGKQHLYIQCTEGFAGTRTCDWKYFSPMHWMYRCGTGIRIKEMAL